MIDHAGSGFVVGGTSQTSGNRIDHNVVINSTGLHNAGLHQGVAISDYWESAQGRGNVFTKNDSYGNPAGVARVSGIQVADNTTSAPHFVDPASHDYRLAGSPAASWGMWNGPSAAAASQAQSRGSGPMARVAAHTGSKRSNPVAHVASPRRSTSHVKTARRSRKASHPAAKKHHQRHRRAQRRPSKRRR